MFGLAQMECAQCSTLPLMMFAKNVSSSMLVLTRKNAVGAVQSPRSNFDILYRGTLNIAYTWQSPSFLQFFLF
jgi:hypothetical protein